MIHSRLESLLAARRRANARLRAARRRGFSRPALGYPELTQSIGTLKRASLANMIYILLGGVGLQEADKARPGMLGKPASRPSLPGKAS